MQRITPFLWFKDNAEEAMAFYTALFPDSKVVSVTKLAPNVPPAGKAMVGTMELMGQQYMVINGGDNSMLATSGPISLVVPCDTQEEIDRLWEALSADGGKPIMCGWITDKFGITWQITPSMMGELMDAKDPARAARVATAMMQMVKLDIAALRAAAEGK